MPRHRSRPFATSVVTLFVVLSAAGVAAAPEDDQQDPNQPDNQQPRGRPDFLFGRPHGSIGLRGSWVFARAGSDLFDFVRNQLTVDKGDFNAPAFAADLGVAVTPRIDALFGVEFSRASTASEYRGYVDNNNLPITQETSLREANLSGSIRIALAPRGRGVSRFAWVPYRFTPYVGGGGGFLWYEFKQVGDFVDFVDLSVFSDVFQSTGWTPSAHAFGGIDMKLYRMLFVTVEGRYLWAAGKLGRDFVRFDPIDLAGFRLAAGVNILF